jgi:hypothetical protein
MPDKHEEGGAVYEITLRSALSPTLTARFPGIAMRPVSTVTILYRRVADSAEVDELMERLRSLGIAPLALHTSSRCCEFRIDGLLGKAILRSMDWEAWPLPERTVLLVSATVDELRVILSELAANGIGIDHFIRHSAA